MTDRTWEVQKQVHGRVWLTIAWNETEDQAKSMADGSDDKRAVKTPEGGLKYQ